MAVRALLIEDSVPIRALLRRRLEAIGCEIVGEAGTAQDGLELTRSLCPDLITLDLLMPDTDRLDSRQLFLAIREELPNVVIIVISVRPRSVEAASFLREGALAYLEKPFISLASLVEPLARVFPELKPSNFSRLKAGLVNETGGRL